MSDFYKTGVCHEKSKQFQEFLKNMNKKQDKVLNETELAELQLQTLLGEKVNLDKLGPFIECKNESDANKVLASLKKDGFQMPVVYTPNSPLGQFCNELNFSIGLVDINELNTDGANVEEAEQMLASIRKHAGIEPEPQKFENIKPEDVRGQSTTVKVATIEEAEEMLARVRKSGFSIGKINEEKKEGKSKEMLEAERKLQELKEIGAVKPTKFTPRYKLDSSKDLSDYLMEMLPTKDIDVVNRQTERNAIVKLWKQPVVFYDKNRNTLSFDCRVTGVKEALTTIFDDYDFTVEELNDDIVELCADISTYKELISVELNNGDIYHTLRNVFMNRKYKIDSYEAIIAKQLYTLLNDDDNYKTIIRMWE